MEKYDSMLNNLYSKLPEKAKEKSRFKMPEFSAFIEGNSTIISNFVDVATALRRDPKHLMKYLSKESATLSTLSGKRLVMKGKFRERLLNERLGKYAREYVLCKECGKPDTSLISQDGANFMRCEACGARSPVAGIK
jgi:translation initiation factor 2 subunit 2